MTAVVSPDLQSSQTDQLVAHVPKHPWLELKPDHKEHHDNAEFGDLLDMHTARAGNSNQGCDDNSCKHVAQH